ncbi:MAG: DUF692 domain-containing protein [Deltaproteobacteria bacterium]|nr:MAG: DUF692 domain-containing protein [Deltaproteobacteria bacterium]
MDTTAATPSPRPAERPRPPQPQVNAGVPFLGYGVGLRRPHFDTIWDHKGEIDFVEILSENYMAFGGRPRAAVERAAREFPVLVHGVGLSIGSVDPLDEDYLQQLLALVKRVDAVCFSDHVCYSSAFGTEYHDLIPLPFTEEALAHVVERTLKVLDRAGGIPFLLENPSYYVEYESSHIPEPEFLNEVCRQSGCGLLLDVNNVYVNSQNHGFDPYAFIDALDLSHVGYVHMAGHTRLPDVIIDTHGEHVIPEVLDLYAYVLEKTGPMTTLLEWDNDIPEIEVLCQENEKIRRRGRAVVGEAPRATR